jgi:hypothetical protein
MSPDEKTAYEALTDAIEAVVRAQGNREQAWVASEYIVVHAAHRFAADGESYTAVGVIYRDQDVPMHRALGLLEFASTRLRKIIAED